MPEWNYATGWEAVADARPEAAALVHGDRRVPWRDFDGRAARLAGAFAELGVGPDAKVASYLYNGPEYMEGVYAAFKARAVPVNVNYRYLADELEYLLESSDSEVLLFHGTLAEHVDAVRGRLPRLRAVIQVDDGSPHLDGALAYEELIAGHDPAPRIDRSPDDLYILYTGGTTGMPKGVMWRQGDLGGATLPAAYLLCGAAMPAGPEGAGSAAEVVAAAGLVPVHVPASPLMHGTGFFTTLQALALGGTVVTLTARSFDPTELWTTVEREGVTQMAIVGDAFAKPMLAALEEADGRGGAYDLSTLRLVISSGVMWTEPVKQALMAHGSFLCFDSLGSSEGVGFATSIAAPGTEAPTARFSIGEGALVLGDDGRPVEPGSGEVGRLAVTGPIPLGYYKDPVKTAETFPTVDGVRYSVPGDWARVAADGTVELLGRGSVSINTGGEKVYPEEVEEALKLHPAVADAVVVGVPDDRFGEAVTAVVSLHDGASVGGDEIRTALDEPPGGEAGGGAGGEAGTGRGAVLARYKRPRHVVVVDAVPRAANGKVDYAWARRTAIERLAP